MNETLDGNKKLYICELGEFYGDNVRAGGAASDQAGHEHRHSQVEPQNSRWRKWSWESEHVYGGEEIIPAVFTDVRQTFTQKYIQPTTVGVGRGGGHTLFLQPQENISNLFT